MARFFHVHINVHTETLWSQIPPKKLAIGPRGIRSGISGQRSEAQLIEVHFPASRVNPAIKSWWLLSLFGFNSTVTHLRPGGYAMNQIATPPGHIQGGCYLYEPDLSIPWRTTRLKFWIPFL
jgi:hypothetical protein